MGVCPKCGKGFNEEKFCMSCGTNLQDLKKDSTQATNASPHVYGEDKSMETEVHSPERSIGTGSPSNDYVHQVKEVSTHYIQFVKSVVKSPTAVINQLYGSSFVNGLITLILFAIFIPLTTYFSLRKFVSGTIFEGSISFSTVFFQPFLFFIIFLAILGGLMFFVTKSGGTNYTFKDVFARFGAFLVIPTVVLFIAFICSVLGIMSLVSYLMSFSFLGLFVAIPFTIYSLKKEKAAGLDPLFGTFITFIVFYIVLRVIAESIVFNNIMNHLDIFW